MRQLYIVALLFFCLNLAVAQTAVLQKRVSLEMKDVTLEKALATLKKKYGIRFSYANSLIPVGQNVTISASNQALSSVLSDLLKETDVVYKTVGEQIVLRIDPNKRRENSASDKRPTFPPVNRIQGIQPPMASTGTVPATRAIIIEPVPVQTPDYAAEQRQRRRQRVQAIGEAVSETARQVADDTKEAAKKLDNSIENRKSKRATRRDSVAHAEEELKAERKALADKAKEERKEKAEAKNENSTQKETKTDEPIAKDSTTQQDSEYETRPFQISFVPPLSTNGFLNTKYINHVSINVIAGMAGGVNGVEFGSIANIDKSTVTGAQFAGMLNIVGGQVKGAQFAGFANIVNQPVQGAQFAGFTNLTRGSVTGGGQYAGFLNIAKGDATVQAAGFANIAQGNVNGAQVSGFLNVAKDVQGAQIAGFINAARHVRGLQLGVVNFADSVSGIQFGLLNFVKHGYYRLEVWGSESMYVNAAFKMGSRQFHNIFAFGYRAEGNKNYTAYGYGFGSELRASNNIAFNLDLIAWHINEDSPWTDALNLHNQFRANVSFRIAGRTQLFVGPTFNVYVSNLYDAEKGRYGTPLTPWKIYDKTHGNTNVTMWPGLNAGIRF